MDVSWFNICQRVRTQMDYWKLVKYIQSNFININTDKFNFYEVNLFEEKSGPRIGDYIYSIGHIIKEDGLYIINACDCNIVITENRWPLRGKDSTCGPHCINVLTGKQDGICWNKGKWTIDGWWLAKNENVEIKQNIQINKHNCLKCGCPGDDLVFAFYCTNINCSNYHK